MALKGSKTEQNLKDAFAGESQANRRYLYFANKADIEGQNDVAALFRSTAEGQAGARREVRRNRRLVRDAGKGRALARQPLPEGARRTGRLRLFNHQGQGAARPLVSV
mgnify:CR=1 FL=1